MCNTTITDMHIRSTNNVALLRSRMVYACSRIEISLILNVVACDAIAKDGARIHSYFQLLNSCPFFFFSVIFAGGSVPPNGENGLFSSPAGPPEGARHIFLPKNRAPVLLSASVAFVTHSLIGAFEGVIVCLALIGIAFIAGERLFGEFKSCKDFRMSLSSLGVDRPTVT